MTRFMGHMYRIDGRIEMMKGIILAIQPQFDKIKESCENHSSEYWDSIYADDAEHLVGIVFIVLQNYINSSISDLFLDLIQLHTKYAIDKKVRNSAITRIELIIAIANFYKHRDLPSKLHLYTTKPFDDLNIKYIQFIGEDGYYSHRVGADSCF